MNKEELIGYPPKIKDEDLVIFVNQNSIDNMFDVPDYLLAHAIIEARQRYYTMNLNQGG